MATKTETLSIGPNSTTIMIDRPKASRAVLILAHGAGAGIDHEFFKVLVPLLVARNITVVRYNFLYMDKGSKRPDRKEVCFKVIAAAIQYSTEKFPLEPIYAGGKSFGGRMTSLYLAGKDAAAVQGIVFLGFPLHRSKEPDTERALHLAGLKIPSLFLQGTRDNLAELPLIAGVVGGLKLAKMFVVDGADHSFEVLKRSGIPPAKVLEDIAEEVSKFVVN